MTAPANQGGGALEHGFDLIVGGRLTYRPHPNPVKDLAEDGRCICTTLPADGITPLHRRPLKSVPLVGVYAVRGNCDSAAEGCCP